MKKILPLLLWLIFSSTLVGQALSEEEIYGKWKVEKVINKPPAPEFAALVEGFEDATFTFRENGNFELTSTSRSDLFELVTEMTNGTKWKLDANKQELKIGKEDDYSVMRISVKELKGRKLFHLKETEMKLQMKKIK